MAKTKNYYDILDIQRDADEATIKKAYRKKAMKYHPDRNLKNKDQAEAQFKQAKEAYEVLSNKDKRSYYDQMLAKGRHVSASDMASGGGFGGQGGGGFSNNVWDIFKDDIFSSIFEGQHTSKKSGQRGSDLAYDLEIDLQDALFGKSVNLTIPNWVSCHLCHGSGAKPGSKPKPCKTCHGKGQLHIQQGFIALQQTCPHCHGQGKRIDNPCSSCRGEGRVKKKQTLAVKIPPGIDTGHKIRLAGQGEAGAHGGKAGDLFVIIHLRPHPVFKRLEQNLICAVPIDFITAALGGEAQVPTLTGRIKLKIPPGTQSNDKLRLRGQGVPGIKQHKVGDLICIIQVETPVKLNQEQKDLLNQLGESFKRSNSKHMPGIKKFFESAQRFFKR